MCDADVFIIVWHLSAIKPPVYPEILKEEAAMKGRLIQSYLACQRFKKSWIITFFQGSQVFD